MSEDHRNNELTSWLFLNFYNTIKASPESVCNFIIVLFFIVCICVISLNVSDSVLESAYNSNIAGM
jgi:hypothetical protein